MARKPAPRKTAKTSQTTSLLEWVAGGLGLAVILAVLAVIGGEAFSGDRSPPAIVVEPVQVTATAGGYLVRVRVRNDGGQSAAQLVVDGRLTPAAGEPETSEATFDYVPRHSSREGGLFFKNDPKTGSLTLRAKGYVEP